MSETKLGRQTPTQSVVLPYSESLGGQAIDLYNQSGRTAQALDTDTYEVSWHSGARPSHQEWQGKWYTHAQLVSVCGLGEVSGLCGANCYHDYYPVIVGISEHTYSPEQLAEMNKDENTPIKDEVTGKEYTKYEALQRQRKLETQMRADRQQIKLLQDAGANEDDIINARCRYQGHSQEYTRFSKAMDMPQQKARVNADGLGAVGVGKTKISVDKSVESGIMSVKETIKSKSLPNSDVGESAIKSDGLKYQKGKSAFTKEVQEKIYRDERIITGNNYETALVFNSQGQKIITKKGSRDEVKFTKAELKQMRGCVVTHNHPNGTCFSTADISVFKDNGISEIRVCTRQRNYSMVAPEKWDTSIERFSDIDKRYNELDSIISNKYADIAAQNGLSILAYDDDIQIEIMKTLSNEMGFKFDVEELI